MYILNTTKKLYHIYLSQFNHFSSDINNTPENVINSTYYDDNQLSTLKEFTDKNSLSLYLLSHKKHWWSLTPNSINKDWFWYHCYFTVKINQRCTSISWYNFNKLNKLWLWILTHRTKCCWWYLDIFKEPRVL